MRRIRSSRLSSNVVSAVLGAAVVAVLSAGTAVAVSTTAVSITNPTTGVRAHVTAKQTLVTSDRDPYTGVYAKVDAAGRQVVGGGVPAKTWTPNTLWYLDEGAESADTSAAVPTTGRLVVRGCTVVVQVPTGQRATAALGYVAMDDNLETEGRSWMSVPLAFQYTPTYGGDHYVGTFVGDFFPKPGTSGMLGVNRSSTSGRGRFWMDCRGELL